MIITGLDAAAITEGLVPVLGPLRRRHKIVLAAVSDPRVDELPAAGTTPGTSMRRPRRRPTGSAGRETVRRSATSACPWSRPPPERFAPELADHYLLLKKAGQL